MSEKELVLCVVRLTTSVWSDDHGLHFHKTLRFLRRQCKGYNFLEEDIKNIGAELITQSITNLDTCKDGIYEVRVCNPKRDWESGFVEEWDYELVPWTKETSTIKHI